MNTFAKTRWALTGWYILILVLLMTISSLVAVDAEKRAFDRIQQALADSVQRPKLTRLLETRLNEFEKRFSRRLTSVNLIFFVIGAFGCYLLSGRTLTPIKEMLDEQEKFAADVSHQLRTPLANIDLGIEVLKRTSKDLPYPAIKTLDDIRQEVIRMKRLVEGLLTLVRAKTIAGQKDWRRLDLTELAKLSFEKMLPAASAKGINLVLKKSPPMFIFGSQSRLLEVIMILIDNAIKYTSKTDRVEIAVLAGNKQAEVRISDNGAGIPAGDLPKIFDRFYRGAKTGTVAGSGLGLAIAEEIVKVHKGSIKVKSSPNKETIFWLCLPKTS